MSMTEAVVEKLLDTENLDAVPETKLPVPKGYRILVEMIQPRTKTKGGIILTDKSREAQEWQRTIGRVVRMGPMCFVGERKYGNDAWCQVGDWIYMGQWSGNPIEIMGHSYRLLNDDQVLAVIPDPTLVKIGGLE